MDTFSGKFCKCTVCIQGSTVVVLFDVKLLTGFWMATSRVSQREVADKTRCPIKTSKKRSWHVRGFQFYHAIHIPVEWLAPWAGNVNQILCCDWLPERARWCYLIHCVPHENIALFPYNKSFIDQAFSVKMAGFWPRSFLQVHGPTLTPSQSINMHKRTWPIYRNLDLTLSL